MRQFLVSFLSFQLVLLPVAMAKESVPGPELSPAEAIEIGKNFISQAEDEGFEVLDETGRRLDLLSLTGTEQRFRIVSPANLRLDVAVKLDEKQGAKIHFVAREAKDVVLARRTA